MNFTISEFNLSRLERVISGPGAIGTLVPELERRGLKRALIVTGKTIGDSVWAGDIVNSIDSRCAGMFKKVRQHVPWTIVHELISEIERINADCLVSLGGGSPIDMSKVAMYRLLTSHPLVHIAIPTTLSAAEYTHSGGVTDDDSRVKSGVSDPRLQPVTVINDPELTLNTPDRLWVSTGMRALDHAIESIYAIRHHPISDTLGARAISMLVEHLPASIRGDREERLVHRGFCQTAAWFSIFGSMNTRFGISHLLGHQIGPRWNVSHGVTSCITLPHAMRFMAEIAPERFGPIAEGFGLPFNYANPKPCALACADRTAQFIREFNVPHSLSDAGVPYSEVSQIVGTVVHELERSGVVERPVTAEEVSGLLEAAYGSR